MNEDKLNSLIIVDIQSRYDLAGQRLQQHMKEQQAIEQQYNQLLEGKRTLEVQRQQVTETLVGKKIEHKRLLQASEQNTNQMMLCEPVTVQNTQQVERTTKHKQVNKQQMHRH